jgi:hypothetical protein
MTINRKLQIIFGPLALGLLITATIKLQSIPRGMILSGLFLGGILLVYILLFCLVAAGILKAIVRKISFLSSLAITSTLGLLWFHYYIYSPSLTITVIDGYTGPVNLVLSNSEHNVLSLDSNGIGYITKWTFDKTYIVPIVVEAGGRPINKLCVGFNPSGFWARSASKNLYSKTIHSLEFEIKRDSAKEKNIFYGKEIMRCVDTVKAL